MADEVYEGAIGIDLGMTAFKFLSFDYPSLTLIADYYQERPIPA